MNNVPKFSIDTYVMISGGYVGRVKKIEIDIDGIGYFVVFQEGNYKHFKENALMSVTVTTVSDGVPQ